MKLSPFLLALSLTGCASISAKNEERQIPVFPRMTFNSDIFLTARLSGTFEQRGKCLVIASNDGSFVTPYWPKQSILGKDNKGYFVKDAPSGEIIHVGDFITGGGGQAFKKDNGAERLKEINAIVTPDIPPECSENIVSIHSFRKTQKWYVGQD